MKKIENVLLKMEEIKGRILVTKLKLSKDLEFKIRNISNKWRVIYMRYNKNVCINYFDENYIIALVIEFIRLPTNKILTINNQKCKILEKSGIYYGIEFYKENGISDIFGMENGLKQLRIKRTCIETDTIMLEATGFKDTTVMYKSTYDIFDTKITLEIYRAFTNQDMFGSIHINPLIFHLEIIKNSQNENNVIVRDIYFGCNSQIMYDDIVSDLTVTEVYKLGEIFANICITFKTNIILLNKEGSPISVINGKGFTEIK